MKTYSVIITPMQKHIADPNLNRDFDLDNKANAYFSELCERFNLDNEDEDFDNECREAGGRGYDYRVELYVTKN